MDETHGSRSMMIGMPSALEGLGSLDGRSSVGSASEGRRRRGMGADRDGDMHERGEGSPSDGSGDSPEQ